MSFPISVPRDKAIEILTAKRDAIKNQININIQYLGMLELPIKRLKEAIPVGSGNLIQAVHAVTLAMETLLLMQHSQLTLMNAGMEKEKAEVDAALESAGRIVKVPGQG